MPESNDENLEDLEAEDFYSDDNKHFVKWQLSEELGYPAWVCDTHQRLYYQHCVNSSEDEQC